MKLKALLVSLLLALQITAASAQSSNPMNDLRSAADLVRSKYATTQSMMSICQMAGDAQQMQICQIEMQCHNAYYNYLEQVAQNPQYRHLNRAGTGRGCASRSASTHFQ